MAVPATAFGQIFQLRCIGYGVFRFLSIYNSEAHPASCSGYWGGGGPFPGTKVRPGLDADQLSPSSAEVENE
jgi:hypothetical protein